MSGKIIISTILMLAIVFPFSFVAYLVYTLIRHVRKVFIYEENGGMSTIPG